MLRDYDKWTPKERRVAHYLRTVPASNVLSERGEDCWECQHSYAEHKGKPDSRYMTACSRPECSCEGYVAPNEGLTAARAQDSDPASADACQENSGSQSAKASESAQEESVDAGVTDTGVSLPVYEFRIIPGWGSFRRPWGWR